jgi:hypothetical protein
MGKDVKASKNLHTMIHCVYVVGFLVPL